MHAAEKNEESLNDELNDKEKQENFDAQQDMNKAHEEEDEEDMKTVESIDEIGPEEAEAREKEKDEEAVLLAKKRHQNEANERPRTGRRSAGEGASNCS